MANWPLGSFQIPSSMEARVSPTIDGNHITELTVESVENILKYNREKYRFEETANYSTKTHPINHIHHWVIYQAKSITMAKSSYQTLSRYDDCYHRYRVRSMVDIRQKHRETLCITRMGDRYTKHFMNRRVVPNCDRSEHEGGSSGPGSTIGYDEDHDSSADSEPCEPCRWGSEDTSVQWEHQSSIARSDTSSPSLSVVSSEYSSVHSDTFRIPSPENRTPSPRPLMIQSRSKPLSRKQLLLSRKRIQADHYDLEMVQNNLDQYSQRLSQLSNNSRKVNDYIYSGVDIISNAIACPSQQVSDQALNLLVSLVKNNLLNIQTIYFVLQQNVLFNLKTSLARHNGNQLATVIRLFIFIVRQEPRSVPFITELMYALQLFPFIDDAFNYGTREETYPSIELYAHLLQAAQEQLQTNFQPILPQRHISKDISTYSPVSTLKRILRPSLLVIFGEKFIKQAQYADEDLLRFSMGLIIRSLNLTYLQLQHPHRDVNFAKETVATLREMDVESALQKFITSDDRHKMLPQSVVEDLRNFLLHFNQILKLFGHDQAATASKIHCQ